MAITFKVSEVDPATTRLPTRTTSAQLAALGRTAPAAHRVGADEVVDGPLVHPLALAIDLAFAEHRPLVLGPDEVWLCLARSLATHVELHAEAIAGMHQLKYLVLWDCPAIPEAFRRALSTPDDLAAARAAIAQLAT